MHAQPPPPPPTGSPTQQPTSNAVPLPTVPLLPDAVANHPFGQGEEGEQLMARMMALVVKLTRPEKNRQENKPLESIPKSRTLYVNNLNEKIDILKLQNDLKTMFGKYGEIVDFSALKTFWRRGQAFITFTTVDKAVEAMRQLQGTVYEGKPMRINFSRKESWVYDEERKQQYTNSTKENSGGTTVSKKTFGNSNA